MTDKTVAEADLPAKPAEVVETLTNAARLRPHLKPGSLAAALLSAWEAGEQKDAQARLLVALQDYKEEGSNT